MSVVSKPTDRPSAEDTNASNISTAEHVADKVYSLLDAVDSESIAEEFRIGINNKKHDFENHVKTVVREGLDPSDSLAELADKTAVDDALEHMPKSRFSEIQEHVLPGRHPGGELPRLTALRSRTMCDTGGESASATE